MIKRVGVSVICCGAALLAGCGQKQPAGQVAATVNGKEVTLQEINTELQNTNLPGNTDKQLAQRALLQRVIERKLIIGLAQDKKLDQSPDYLAQKRRMEEMLLAQTYAKQQLAAVPVPTEAEVSKFMTDNPGLFSQREQLVLDQIRFPVPSNVAQLKALQDVHTLDGVAAFLTAHNIKFERGAAGLDSASLPPAILKKIEALPAGEPWLAPAGGMVTINVITGRRPIPVEPAQARTAAVTAWRQQKVQQLLSDQLAAAKGSAKITYQPGFAPPENKKPAAGSATAGPAPMATPS